MLGTELMDFVMAVTVEYFVPFGFQFRTVHDAVVDDPLNGTDKHDALVDQYFAGILKQLSSVH